MFGKAFHKNIATALSLDLKNTLNYFCLTNMIPYLNDLVQLCCTVLLVFFYTYSCLLDISNACIIPSTRIFFFYTCLLVISKTQLSLPEL